jgi:hypothetical protein
VGRNVRRGRGKQIATTQGINGIVYLTPAHRST